MEAQWQADRAMLRRLMHTQPRWTQQTYAHAVGRSLGWVKKWIPRLRAAAPDDDTVLRSRSRARHHPPPCLSQLVIDRLLALRAAPPAPLNRIPGPKTLRYYLEQDEDLRRQGLRLPRSTRTIWRILRQYGRIGQLPHRDHVPVPRPAPLCSWQLDFKDVSTVPADPDGKRQHVVEVLNSVDTGTSILLAAQVRADFTMATAIAAVAEVVRQHGLPERVTFDRDPRFVGAPQQRDFPSPFVRFWLCLGVQVTICPPRRPDTNAFVERYHRSFEYECLRIYRPADLPTATTVTASYKQFYNEQRPHQGLSCHNLPPRVAFPTLPTLAPLPRLVDGDAWLATVDGHRFARHADRHATVRVAEQRYYLNAALAGRAVALRVDAHAGEFSIEEGGHARQRLPIKGLGMGIMSFEHFVAQLCAEAQTIPMLTIRAPFQQRLGL